LADVRTSAFQVRAALETYNLQSWNEVSSSKSVLFSIWFGSDS